MEKSVDSWKRTPSGMICMNHCNAQWIPAYAGMTQYYHEERAQQPWIPAYAGLPRHSREGGNP